MIAISILLALVYAGIQWMIVRAWKAIPDMPFAVNRTQPTVSVVIAARNEAKNIESCLKSILDTRYPRALLEVVVVDDHSEDGTRRIAERVRTGFPKIRIEIIAQKHGLEGKKSALRTGIDGSSGSVILTTDADCFLPPDWIPAMMAPFGEPKVQAVAGPVVFEPVCNALEAFQALDFLGMMGITGAGISQKWWRMGNGANLAYRREAFTDHRGFDGIDRMASGDDMLLLQKIAHKAPESIRFAKSRSAVARTRPQSTWAAFFEQRLRWASKTGAYTEYKLQAVLLLVLLFCCSLVVNCVWVVFNPAIWYVPAIQIVVKAVFDYFLLREMAGFFDKKALLRHFFTSLPIHTLYIVGIGMMSLVKKTYRWKGREVK